MPRSPTPELADAGAVAQATAQHPFNMSENWLHLGRQACGSKPRCREVRDKWLVGLVFLTLMRTGEALAAEQVTFPGEALKPDFNASSRPPTPLSAAMGSIPSTYQAMDLPEGKVFSTRDFRPRGRSILEVEPRAGTSEDAPMLRNTTVWQRLSDYRSHDRVRVLTLWETGGSSVSLQAGRKGEPSLQWTSRAMNRGGATRGLLDKVVSISVAGAGRSLHFPPRATNTEPVGKPAKLMEAGGGALK